jgi:hypothetical protein
MKLPDYCWTSGAYMLGGATPAPAWLRDRGTDRGVLPRATPSKIQTAQLRRRQLAVQGDSTDAQNGNPG